MNKKISLLSIFLVIFVLAFSVNFSAAAGSPKDNVRVWVQYQPGQRGAVRSALETSKAQFHYTFTNLDSYVVTLPAPALNGIMNNPNVLSVEEDVKRFPVGHWKELSLSDILRLTEDTTDENGQIVPWGIDAVQARDVWDTDRDGTVDMGAPTGAGRTVCIIDTGYYQGHEDLPMAVGGYSQVDDEWARDGVGHGTHVAGTIDGVNNTLGVVGVSPGDISLFIIKIFNDDGAWTTASDLVDAINRCAENGANVISMSLGGGRASNLEKRAFNTLYEQGILHVAAAGNAGDTSYSYPASYDSVVSVAAIDENFLVADFSQQNDQVEISAPGVNVLSTVPFLDENSLIVDNVSYEAFHVEYAARGTASGSLVDGGLCDSIGSWPGKVVLCQRGVISFYDKVMNVQNGGGTAALIYNNVEGSFLGTLDVGNSSEIIALSLTKADGEYLVTYKLGVSAEVASSHTWPYSGYEAWNGTSMATPHVSAVAALIWSAYPGLSNVDIRSAMNATALDLGPVGRDSAYGNGLVQANTALQYLGGGVTDNPPSITINNPTEGATVSGTVAITADATDDNGISQVEFFIGVSSLGIDSDGSDGWGVSWDTTAIVDGGYTISAIATDTEGLTASHNVSVSVDNSGGVTDPFSLSVYTYKVKGRKHADLSWVGTTATLIDIYRDESIIITTENDGFYTDVQLSVGGGSATYMVCEAGTETCSNEVAVNW